MLHRQREKIFQSKRFTRRSSRHVSFSSSSSIGRETLVSLSIFVLRSETATFAQSDHEINIPSSSLDNWADVEEDDDPKINRLQIDSRWCWSESVVLTQQMRRHRSMFMSEKLRRDAGRNDTVLSFLDEIVQFDQTVEEWEDRIKNILSDGHYYQSEATRIDHGDFQRRDLSLEGMSECESSLNPTSRCYSSPMEILLPMKWREAKSSWSILSRVSFVNLG